MEDELKKLNDELRKQPKAAKASGPWLALESNPKIFTDFGHKIGLDARSSFCDVLGLDEELLQLLPPAVACVLLFPCSEPNINDDIQYTVYKKEASVH